MPSFNVSKNSRQLVVLGLLSVALLGPWTYSSDGVPPPEWCRSPYLLLESGRCIDLISGASLLFFVAGGVISWAMGPASGVPIFPLNARNILLMLATFGLVLPYFSTLYQIYRSARPGVVHLVTWALAALAALMALVLLPSSPDISPIRMWGIWLYIGVAIAQLIVGGPALSAKN